MANFNRPLIDRNQAAGQPQSRMGDQQWKADGFINMYLPGKDGQRRKLGSISLRNNKPQEAQLIAWLNEDPARVAKILDKLQLEYNAAIPDEENVFDLSE